MIIDSHVHVWTQQPEKYPWAPIGNYVPDSEASVEKLLQVMDATQVEKAVLVQPTPYGWDNRYLLDSMQKYPDRFKAVCLVDPFSSGNAKEMTRLVRQFGVSGFRLNWNLHPATLWETSQDHAAFWDAAGELDSALCIQCTPDHFDLLGSTCRKYPAVKVVIDHLGRVSAENGLDSPEFLKLLSLADLPNVHVKISGWYYCSQQNPPIKNVHPIVGKIVKAFSARRCVWGSDFPFIQEKWDVSEMIKTIRKWDFLTTDDLDWMMGQSAQNLWWKQPAAAG